MTSVLEMQFRTRPETVWWPWWVVWGQPLALLCLIAIVMMSLFGLLAIWAGLGRGHWFIRAAVVLGCISLLLVVPAFELVTVYMVQCGLTIIALGAWRNWRLPHGAASPSPDPSRMVNARRAWQFSILDLMLLTLLVAWMCAMVTSAPHTAWVDWPALLAEGAVAALLTVAAAWIALSGTRWWLRLLVFLILPPAALMVAWLALWRLACRAGTASRWSSWRGGLPTAALGVTSLLIAGPAATICWWLAHPRTVAETAAPSPNGYDELVRAGKVLEAVNVPYFDTATQAQLKAYVLQCSAVYEPIRAALGKPCQVPPRRNFGDIGAGMERTTMVRAVARALCGKGRLAAMEGRNADAIAAYTDSIRLGHAAMRDGMAVDLLVGITFEGIGRSGIARMRQSLSAKDCVALLPTLKDLLDRPLPLDECVARDLAFGDRIFGWQGHLADMIVPLFPQKNLTYAADRELAQSRLLICELAIRAYSLEHGRNPAALGDLVPRYLSEVPKDPFGGGEFIYRVTPTGYELHSAGIEPTTGRPISADDP
jgi:hypothetical protein